MSGMAFATASRTSLCQNQWFGCAFFLAWVTQAIHHGERLNWWFQTFQSLQINVQWVHGCELASLENQFSARRCSGVMSKRRGLSLRATKNVCSGNGGHNRPSTPQTHPTKLFYALLIPRVYTSDYKAKTKNSHAYRSPVQRVTLSRRSAKTCGDIFGRTSVCWRKDVAQAFETWKV